MSSALPELEEAGDAELISAVRGGDLSAYGTLFERHVDAARRLARQIAGPSDADDLVSDSFAKVLRVLQRGGGPDVAFRAYLLTAVRRLHVDRVRSSARLHTTDDLEPFDPGVPFRDTAVEGFESEAAAQAFASLPERWQLVLWHTEVEGQKPADVAKLLGMSPNSVSALAYRAREGLRQAFLNSHATELEDEKCRWTHEHLGGYVRNGISRRDATKVEKHLEECRKCMAIYLELTEVNSNLGALLAPLLLGSAGLAYLGTAGGLAAKGGILLFLDRAKELVAANTQAAAVGGVVTVTAVAGVSVALVAGVGDREPEPSDHAVAQPAPKTDRATPPRRKPNPQRKRRQAPPPQTTAPTPTTPTTTAPEPEPAPEPTQQATQQPDQEPRPTRQPTPSPTPTPKVEDPGETTEPPPTDPPEPTYDLRITSARVVGRGPVVQVIIDTAGYAPNGTATLRVQQCLLGACEPLLQGSYQLSAADPSETMHAVRIPDGTSIQATLSADNFTDSNDGNNQRTWEWSSR